METRTWRIRYARAAALVGSLTPILTQPSSQAAGRRGQAAADTSTNSLIVTDIATRMPAIDSFIRLNLDVRTQQVAIQAKIIFVDRTDLENLGLRYDLGTVNQFYNRLIQRTNPTTNESYTADQTIVTLGGNAVAAVANAQARFPAGGPSALELVYSTVIGNFALSTFLEALQSVTLADVQAEPQVTVIDNQKAEIFVGQRTPIRVADPSSPATGPARVMVQFQATGIKLTVTPHVVQESREVLMELHAERSNIDVAPTADVGGIFGTQEGTTTVLVRDGQTAVIGGLTVTEVSVSKNGIPFLVDLPVIGRLFGFRTTEERRRDLLILVTPHIVDDASAPPSP
jgi:type IV pilus assembly protein PilQ